MSFKWSLNAIDDLMEAVDFIAKDNPKAAYEVMDKIKERSLILDEHSEIGRPRRTKGTRELVLLRLPFTIIYSIPREEILNVFHTSRKWK